MTNPLLELKKLGQSVWLDYIRRDLITSGELKQLIDCDGLAGVTSNPAIFEKAITSSHDYDHVRERMRGQKALDVYEAIAFQDVQFAADVFAPVYEQTQGGDGYVSIEVPANLAYDTAETIRAAQRYWATVNRKNVMIKIPATKAGIPAIAEVLAQGINVNVTLIFAVERYLEVTEAYLDGLERRAQQGLPIHNVASVASFFVSRVDTLIDKQLDNLLHETQDALVRANVQALLGRVAIANSKIAYSDYQKIFDSERFAKLRKLGARPQRVLWASTSTKNPQYPDTYYVDELIGSETVNTLPPDTLKLFRAHGKVRPSLTEDVVGARAVFDQLAAVGVDLGRATQQLEDEGVKLFDDAYNKLLKAIEAK